MPDPEVDAKYTLPTASITGEKVRGAVALADHLRATEPVGPGNRDWNLCPASLPNWPHCTGVLGDTDGLKLIVGVKLTVGLLLPVTEAVLETVGVFDAEIESDGVIDTLGVRVVVTDNVALYVVEGVRVTEEVVVGVLVSVGVCVSVCVSVPLNDGVEVKLPLAELDVEDDAVTVAVADIVALAETVVLTVEDTVGVTLGDGVTVGVGDADGGAIAYSLKLPSLALLDPPM